MLKKILLFVFSVCTVLFLALLTYLTVMVRPIYQELDSYMVSVTEGQTIVFNKKNGFQFKVDSECEFRIVNLYYLVVMNRFSVVLECEDRDKNLRITRVSAEYQSTLRTLGEGEDVVYPGRVYRYQSTSKSPNESLIIFGGFKDDSIVISSQYFIGDYLEAFLSEFELVGS